VRHAIILFDVDGTLVRGRGAGRRALEEVFAERFGRPDAFEGARFGGRTDRGIVRAALARVGAEADEGAIDAVLARYLEVFPRWAAELGYEALPGVGELVPGLVAEPRFAVGLGTGNVEAAARIKVSAAGIEDRFAFGGFGCDAEDRAALLQAGVDRGLARLAASRADCSVIVIGDTPRDVSAAQRIGARCLAVATGGASGDELAAAGADRVLPSLEGAAAALAELLR